MTVGLLLKDAREKAGLSVDEVAAITRIRGQIIRDLERGDLSSSGGMAYARGHIRSIAKAINADADSLIEQFNAEWAADEVSQRSMKDLLAENSATPISKDSPKLSYKKLSYIGAALLALIILVPFATSFFSSSKKSEPAKVAASATPTPTATGSSTPSPAPSVASPTPLASLSPSASSTSVATAGQVVFTAKGGNSWFSVADKSGTILWHGTLFAGASQSFSANSLIDVTIGNAGVVDVTINGKDAGLSGTIGQVVHVQYGPGAHS